MISFSIAALVSTIVAVFIGRRIGYDAGRHDLKCLTGRDAEVSWDELMEGFCQDIRDGVPGYKWVGPETLVTPHTGGYRLKDDSKQRNNVLKAFHDRFRYEEAQKFLGEHQKG